ncbi:MAG TPA: hypothetical protein VE954_01850 [Oligoflexus sp.]|uniref:hypothetical protein n=1 Tax=Oligoflexus sp. TaxID=1971216 RepID=UPI002D5735D3|nr:hypothetical protein [Oligoflexus sp.]HYX31828.1 hypothetical protein [Oligoflexus sp.]
MNYAPIIVFFAHMFMISMQLVAAEANASLHPAYESPYFIAGIRCKGFRSQGLVFDDSLSEVVKGELLKSGAQDDCEQLFRYFGVKKYQWMSGEDLERLGLNIRLSNVFESHEIELVPTEEKGHVFIILQVVPRKVRYHLSLSSATDVFEKADAWQTSLAYLLTDRNHQPIDSLEYGAVASYWEGASPFFSNALRPRDMNRDQTPQKVLKSARFHIQRRYSFAEDLGLKLGVQLIADNDGARQNAAPFVSTVWEADLHTSFTLFRHLGEISLGPGVAIYEGEERVYTQEGEFTSVRIRKRSEIWPRLIARYQSGHEASDFFRVEAEESFSKDGKRVSRLALAGQEFWPHAGNLLTNFDFCSRRASHGGMPTDRIRTENPVDLKAQIGIGTQWVLDQSLQNALAIGGVRVVEESTQVLEFRQSSPFLGVSYGFMDDDLRVSVQAVYYAKRLY